MFTLKIFYFNLLLLVLAVSAGFNKFLTNKINKINRINLFYLIK